jgi:LmbE family N-acetylglucosaminyl deacetylase
LLAIFLMAALLLVALLRASWGHRLLWLLAFLAAIFAWASINGRWLFARFYDVREGLRTLALPEAPSFSPEDRLLVIAPHPDDESLAASGQLQQALVAGAQVFVVFLTCGDGFEWDAMVLARRPGANPAKMLNLGKRRVGEAQKAMAILGIAPENITFLGYPDGGLLRLMLEHYAQPYTSRHTGASKVPYDIALRPGAPYTGRDLERDFASVLDRTQPTIVLVPSPKDAHKDHQAAAYLAMRLLSARDMLAALRYYVVHGGYEYPLPKGYFPRLPLYPPPRARTLPWRRVSLRPEEVTRKLEATCAHKSQTDVMKRFLVAFARRNELWSPLPVPAEEQILGMLEPSPADAAEVAEAYSSVTP